jgi:hypothetical protein
MVSRPLGRLRRPRFYARPRPDTITWPDLPGVRTRSG